ncbi:tetratricopeptide repeat protein [Pseudooceanicola aestuarii]|uniref:tetratricopeptide repeat protein n=1 Tax=Pseudooceanicola aestuarii TaxID=2697319 RepID=UPI0013CFCFCA|nr:tetratricopeptide repeat protein [Pseudooceanicola aestuarii]
MRIKGLIIPVQALGIPALAILALAGCAAGPQVMPQGSAAETEQVAEAAFSTGSAEEAARLFERAAERDPNSSNAYLGLGRSYLALGQYSRAEFALTRANDLAPRDADILNELGNLHLRSLHPARALPFYDAALRRDRRHLSALTGKGVALDFLSEHPRAQQVYRDGLHHYPTNFVLLNNYALSQALSGQINAGLKIMEELLRDPEQGDDVRGNMALAYMLAGRDNDARAILTGVMSGAEIDERLRHYAGIAAARKAGQPVGYMVFN